MASVAAVTTPVKDVLAEQADFEAWREFAGYSSRRHAPFKAMLWECWIARAYRAHDPAAQPPPQET